MRTRLVLATIPVALISATIASSSAAPKPFKGTFDAAATPDPTATAGEVCQGLTPTSRFEVPLKVPAAGTLKVDLTGFQGDWDLTVENTKGAVIASSAGFIENTTEKISLKLKKAMEVTVVACNFAGTPAASGSYEYIPLKK